jgi:hypothetical protein
MKIEIYLDDFQLMPSVWRCWLTGEQARYFDHTWAIVVSWLWWELEIFGTPMEEEK